MVIRRRSNSHCEPFRSKSYNQADRVPSAKVTCKLPRRPRINDEAMALVLINVLLRWKRDASSPVATIQARIA
jgi:hypothetical protein